MLTLVASLKISTLMGFNGMFVVEFLFVPISVDVISDSTPTNKRYAAWYQFTDRRKFYAHTINRKGQCSLGIVYFSVHYALLTNVYPYHFHCSPVHTTATHR